MKTTLNAAKKIIKREADKRGLHNDRSWQQKRQYCVLFEKLLNKYRHTVKFELCFLIYDDQLHATFGFNNRANDKYLACDVPARGPLLRKLITSHAKKMGMEQKAIKEITDFLDSLVK